MTGSPHRPRFVFDATVLTLDWAARPWAFPHSTIGGVEWSAAGLPASYVVRGDHDLEITLRAQEYERNDVEALIAYGQTSQPFAFWPDADGATSHTVLLVRPHAGDDWRPERDDAYPHQFFVTLTLRKTNGQRWTEEYFAP